MAARHLVYPRITLPPYREHSEGPGLALRKSFQAPCSLLDRSAARAAVPLRNSANYVPKHLELCLWSHPSHAALETSTLTLFFLL